MERDRLEQFASILGSAPRWESARGILAQSAAPAVIERPTIEELPSELGGHEWIVTVYDNDYNTYDEVMTVLMVATGCTADEAYIETWEIDHLGCCVVHHASEPECREAAEIIATIGIRVEVSKE